MSTSTPTPPSSPQTLLFDADDTLWENNIYFERAIAAFISFLDHHQHTPDEVREHLNRIERETVAAKGYGTASFRLSLVRCFRELSETSLTPAREAQIMRFVDSIAESEIELLPGVPDALRSLSARHRLLLMTKGDDLEQREKLRRSGLEPLFAGVEVVIEKTPESYREVTARHGCAPGSTWMIGNSPRSDINPALAAGLHAIFVPHAETWVLEHEQLDPAQPGQHLWTLPSLSEIAARL